MFTKFKRSSRLLFLDPLHPHLVEYEKGEKFSIILSPASYWVQKVSLPVKYIREVKKLLPSLFEDILPEGNYSYTAYKRDDAYFIFAYEDKKILELLQLYGINMADISSVHFAQSEFEALETPLRVNEREALYSKDGIVGIAPVEWFAELQDLKLEALQLSKYHLKLQQYGHIVKSSSLYKIAGLLGALILLLFAESFITSQKIQKIDASKEQLFSKYKLQSTMFQNRSLESKYKKIHQKQSRLRERISYLLSMPLQKSQRVTLIEYKNSLLKAKISGVKQQEEQKVLHFLKKKKVKLQESLHKDQLQLEMQI